MEISLHTGMKIKIIATFHLTIIWNLLRTVRYSEIQENQLQKKFRILKYIEIVF